MPALIRSAVAHVRLFFVAALVLASVPAEATTVFQLTTAWTKIASAGATIDVQNRSTDSVILSTTNAVPAASNTDGQFLLSPGQTDSHRFLTLTSDLYARATNSGALVAVLDGVSAGGGGGGTVTQGAPGSSASPWFVQNVAPLPAGTNAIGSVADTNSAAFLGAVAMTVGATYAAQRSIAALCTAGGNMAITFSDASTFVVPVAVGFQTFPFAVTAVNTSGTTATCTYANFK